MKFPLTILFLAACLTPEALAQMCAPPGVLQPAGVVSGTLNQANCLLSDGTIYADYLLTIPSHGTLIVQADASSFPPLVILRDAAGNALASGKNLRQAIEPGDYHLLVNAASPGQAGDFTLRTTFQREPDILCQSFARIGAGRSVSGQLNASSCTLPDGSAYDAYAITIYGSGTLDVSMDSPDFNTYAILRGETGIQLASASNGGAGTTARISVQVSGNETYTIIASAADAGQKPGNYRLSTAFTPADGETCVPAKVLTDSDQVPGSIAVGSCAFNLPQRQDSALFNFYDIRVPSDGFADIEVKNATFGPLLLLLDADGNPVAEDIQSGGSNVPIVRQQLAPGNYRLVVFDEDSFGGDYALQYSFRPGLPEICPVLALNATQTVTGTLDGSASCRTGGLVADVYRITLPASGTLDLNLSSSDFTTSLELRDAKDNRLTDGEQTSGGASSRVLADLPAGVYTVVAASLDSSGGYSLGYQVTPKDLAPCQSAQPLPLNSGYIGLLGAGAPGGSNCTGPGGRPFDRYQFTTATDGTVAAVMTSKVVDSLLTLTGSTGAVLRFDDHSYAGDNALIVQYLPAGTYRLEARPAGTRTSGNYRVDLLFSVGGRPGFCDARPLANGAPVNANLNFTSCQYLDHTFADFYQFSVTGATMGVQIDAASQNFNAYLILLDAKGNLIATDDDSGGGTNARLQQNLDPGTYFAVVKPSDDPATSGDYSITLAVNPIAAP
ncbi:MAG: pre-peptidase C-terminal domain-containing protein [Acidobacteriota bacterium]|nr:pre-peptidase C-terminal domain-containing protein [Acidobacteriota bacterium]